MAAGKILRNAAGKLLRNAAGKLQRIPAGGTAADCACCNGCAISCGPLRLGYLLLGQVHTQGACLGGYLCGRRVDDPTRFPYIPSELCLVQDPDTCKWVADIEWTTGFQVTFYPGASTCAGTPGYQTSRLRAELTLDGAGGATVAVWLYDPSPADPTAAAAFAGGFLLGFSTASVADLCGVGIQTWTSHATGLPADFCTQSMGAYWAGVLQANNSFFPLTVTVGCTDPPPPPEPPTEPCEVYVKWLGTKRCPEPYTDPSAPPDEVVYAGEIQPASTPPVGPLNAWVVVSEGSGYCAMSQWKGPYVVYPATETETCVEAVETQISTLEAPTVASMDATLCTSCTGGGEA